MEVDDNFYGDKDDETDELEDLEEEDLMACLLFAARISEVKNISKLVA